MLKGMYQGKKNLHLSCVFHDKKASTGNNNFMFDLIEPLINVSYCMSVVTAIVLCDLIIYMHAYRLLMEIIKERVFLLKFL